MHELIDKKQNSPKNLQTYMAVFFAAAILYIATCAPGILWQDSGHFQYRIFHNDLEGSLGLALAHPLYILLGIITKYIPLGELSFKVNLISAIAGAVTIANLFLLIRLWSGKLLPATIASLSFAVSHTFWFHCTIAETYTLYTALFSAELVMLLLFFKTKKMKFLYWIALLNGLAIATHMWAILALGCYIVGLLVLLKRKKIPLSSLFVCIAIWCIGAFVYIFLVVKNMISTGDVPATLSSAFFGNVWQDRVLNISISLKIIKENFILMAYNFPTPNAMLFFIGLYALVKKQPLQKFCYLLISMLIIYFVFAFRYTVPDRFAFFVPFYLLASILIGLGANILLARTTTSVPYIIILILTLLPIPTYIIAPKIAEKLEFSLNTKRQIPFRNDYEWFLSPWKTNCYGPLKFSQEVFRTLPQNAAIYADSTIAPPLLYLNEVHEKRKDVKVLSSFAFGPDSIQINEENILRILNKRPFYVVSTTEGYYPSCLIDKCDFIKEGIIWHVVRKKIFLKQH
ncbi:MAG: protein O-mannosyl-transferase family [Planctomycetota bacterium]|jgi:hypothetical protein